MTETIPLPLEPHLSDGELVRLLDGEADAGEGTRPRAHAESCAHCAARLAVLRHRTARLGALLRRTDLPVPAASPGTAGEAVPGVIPLRRRAAPAPPAGRPWLRVAAVVAVALGVGVMASPARAWIAEWISARWETAEGGGGARPAPAPAPSAGPARAGPAAVARVEFTPAGSDFTLEVAHRQQGGAVLLERAAGAGATAEVVGGTGSADLLVLPSGLRISNAPGSAAEYRVTVPGGVRRIRLRIGGGRAATVETASITPGGRRIALGGS